MRTLITVCCLFVLVSSYSQTKRDSSLIFEKAKGSLRQPLVNFMIVPQPNVPEKDRHLLPKTVSYLCQKADTVRSVFEGKVISIAEVGGGYLVMTAFGNYSIAYSGLSKPFVKEGSYVKRNQVIATLNKNPVGMYFLLLQFYKDDKEVNPNDWIR